MNLIEIIFFAGAQCVSPLQSAEGHTIAGKVACAVLVKRDEQTSEIVIYPSTAAREPKVIAMLGRSLAEPKLPDPPPETLIIEATSSDPSEVPEGDGVDVPDVEDPPEAPAKLAEVPKRKKSTKAASTGKRKTAAVRLRDRCGSYKAVWYTNKEGRRKYRCVRV